MKLTIEIDDEIIIDIRRAFSRQDTPATDEQLVEACQAYMVNTTAHVLESEERAIASRNRQTFLQKAGVQSIDVEADAPAEADAIAELRR